MPIRRERYMKILITTDWYRPAINGVVTSVENLRTGLLNAGHEVRVVTLSQNLHSWSEEGVYYLASLNMGMVYEKARVKLHVPKDMIRDILAWGPDVIHSQCEFSTFRVAKEVASLCNIPIAHTYHTVYENYMHYIKLNHKMGVKLAEVLSRKLLSSTDAVIAPSEKIESMLLRYRVKEPICVIPSGIDVEQFASDKSSIRERIRNEWDIRPDETLLISIGRLAKEKNLDEIIDYLQDEHQGLKLMIVGDGPYREELEKLASELGVQEKVIFTGMVSPDEVADYYPVGDIFVSASRSETQGLTYMEAMSSGLPLLCHDDECLDDVIQDGENGYLYRSEDEFMQKLDALVGDEDLRKEMGRKACEYMRRRYSIETFADSCLAVYRDAILRRGNAYECREAL